MVKPVRHVDDSLETKALISEKAGKYDPQLIKAKANGGDLKPSLPKGPAGSVVHFVFELSRCMGWKLLFIMFCGNLVCMFGCNLQRAANPFLFKLYHTKSSTMEVFSAVQTLPFSCQVALGVLSDMFPIGGLRKMPLLILASILGIGSLFLIAGLPLSALSDTTLCLLLIGPALHGSSVMVCLEAMFAQKVREHPDCGPRVTGYWFALGVLARFASIFFPLITHNGRRDIHCVYKIAGFLALPVTAAGLCNFHGEPIVSQVEALRHRAKMLQYPGLLGTSGLVVALALFLAIFNLFTAPSVFTRVMPAIICIAVVMLVVRKTLPPLATKICIFKIVSDMSYLSIQPATFYFYTDTKKEYPEGPHFDQHFLYTVLGIVSMICSLVSLGIYTRYMQSWKFRWVLACGPIANFIVHLPDLILFTRLNLRWGISDKVFVLGSEVLHDLPQMWAAMPIALLMAKACIPGMEATMFAFLCSCSTLASSIARYLSSMMLVALRVNPRGRPGDASSFKNLPVACLCCCVLPLVTLPLLPLLIPDARQTDDQEDMHKPAEKKAEAEQPVAAAP